MDQQTVWQETLRVLGSKPIIVLPVDTPSDDRCGAIARPGAG